MNPTLFTRSVQAALLLLALSACQSLPSTGPSLRQISQMQPESERSQVQAALPPVQIIDIDDAVSLQMAKDNVPQSLTDLAQGKDGAADAVGVGDVLEITLWESPPALLFGGAINSMGSGTAQTVALPAQMVSANGTISVPFLGNIAVKGKTPEQIQQQIVAGLQRKANQPQALVRLTQNNSANATIIRAGRSVRVPLTANRERVLDAVAAVGGVEQEIYNISLQLTRGNQVRVVPLEDIAAQPAQNIVLRAGDVLTLQTSPQSFTALGAVGKNQAFNISARGMNLGEAMGAMGGLLDRRSDPRGVFVFRYQTMSSLSPAEQIIWKQRGYAPHMNVPVVYRMDLTQPHSLFWLQRFAMRDKDIIYVANAPVSELQKFLQFVFAPVTTGVGSINGLMN